MSQLRNASIAEATDLKNVYIAQNNNHERCLKSSSSVFKHKCHKVLKKKLKKYKIRRNGEEDPDVIDVSKSFLHSLIIKSPGSENSSHYKCEVSHSIQPNYLFKKMGKRKKCVLTESNQKIEDSIKPDILSPAIESQDKNHTNAFKVMMDSRHKSIGQNSPGKDKPINDVESQEIIEKREIKAKRMLSLQKMAEAKGSLKNQEKEEQREILIKKQMLKRAEKFKAMITQNNEDTKKNSKVKDPSPKAVNEVKEDRIDIKKTLQLCNIFDASQEQTNNKQEKKVSCEDEEFLNKLSPSIRKKENMMSYFKKLPKEIEDDDNTPEESSHNVIKVKFTPKRKKKLLKKKSLVCDSNGDYSNENDNSKKDSISIRTCENEQKPSVNNTNETVNLVTSKCDTPNDGSRPKRIAKRPAKYLDNIDVSSSDEELHIFTPKKKKNSERQNTDRDEIKLEKIITNTKDKNKTEGNIVQISKKNTSEVIKTKNKDNSKQIGSKTKMKSTTIKNSVHPVKLAPIFMAKQVSSVNLIDKDAKQKFLQSGIPEKLKKNISLQQNLSTIDYFHPVVHIQQTERMLSNKISNDFKNIFDDMIMDSVNDTSNVLYENLLNLNVSDNLQIPLPNKSKEEHLQYIKKSYQKFPVYRTYHLLKGKSRGEFRDCNYPDLDNSIEIVNGLSNNDNDGIEKLCWVDKYKPNTAKQIIGNFTAIEELKKWLQSWTENLIKTRKGTDSEGSDFSDFVDSDADSRDTIKNSNSVLIISGEVGSGKTSSVYAVAAELAIKVIEVNSSSKRTGKIMLQDLQEATRSHKVNRGKNGLESSQNIQEVVKTKGTLKKRGRPKKVTEVVSKKISASQKSEHSETPSSQESVRTDMSLILIDDADIVFDQDDGFCSAITQLIQSSKRPVILVTSSLSCPHLQKFIQYGKIIKMQRFLPHMLGVWLDIMCLADIGTCCAGLGNNLLECYKGDIRKTINWLQFYMTSYKYINKSDSASQDDAQSQELDKHKFNIDDECSSMSWTDREYIQENVRISSSSKTDVSKNFVQQNVNVMLNNNMPLNLLSLWWSIPKILDYDELLKENHTETQKSSSKEMFILSKMMDTVSEADFITGNILDDKNEITNSLWCSRETASVDESENLDYYNWSKEVRLDVASELSMMGLKYSHKELRCETSLDMSIPGYTIERERDKIVGRHHTLTNYLSPGVVLDRKALALDYWSSCRTICRIEMNKTDANVKRNNRFCHYLKSLNVLCKNDYFDALTQSLNTSNDIGK